MKLRQTLKEIGFIVGLSLITAFITNYFSPSGIALVGQWDIQRGVISAQTQNNGIRSDLEIHSVKLAKQIFDEERAIFIDARSHQHFEDGHIPNAISLPIGKFDEMIESFLNNYPLSQPIITYCSGRTCEDSHRLSQFLLEFGYTNVKIFIDGFPGWLAEGYPVE